MSIYSKTLVHAIQDDTNVNFILTPGTHIHTVNNTLVLTSVCISHHDTATSECSSGSVHQAVAVADVVATAIAYSVVAAIVYCHREGWEGRELCGTHRQQLLGGRNGIRDSPIEE